MENNMTEFFMAIIPPTKTHQEKQVRIVKGKPIFYEPAELKAVRAKLEAHLAKHVPEQKYTGAVRLLTKWCFPIAGAGMMASGKQQSLILITWSRR